MCHFDELHDNELMAVDGGAGLEILIGKKVLTGLAAWGTVGLGVAVLGGVALLGYYVASKN